MNKYSIKYQKSKLKFCTHKKGFEIKNVLAEIFLKFNIKVGRKQGKSRGW